MIRQESFAPVTFIRLYGQFQQALRFARGQMNQQQASTQVISLNVRLVRQAALLGAPLLLLSSVIWPSVAGNQGTFSSALALILLVIYLRTHFDRSIKLQHPKNLAIVIGVIIF